MKHSFSPSKNCLISLTKIIKTGRSEVLKRQSQVQFQGEKIIFTLNTVQVNFPSKYRKIDQ